MFSGFPTLATETAPAAGSELEDASANTTLAVTATDAATDAVATAAVGVAAVAASSTNEADKNKDSPNKQETRASSPTDTTTRPLTPASATSADAVSLSSEKVAAAAAIGPGPSNVHRVQMDFNPSMDDELELRVGQLVRLLHEYDDGWVCSLIPFGMLNFPSYSMLTIKYHRHCASGLIVLNKEWLHGPACLRDL